MWFGGGFAVLGDSRKLGGMEKDEQSTEVTTARLLPWRSPEGKRCVLITDNEGGLLSHVAGEMERVQLAMGAELLDHAAALLADSAVTEDQLRYLACRLAEAPADTLSIAEGRGDRRS
ncbi:hypothetical protein SAMN05428945_1009 [Streptomyces sp. 2224.1]|nr:hypothetical protein SAMN05428945_1009 [Streptomyces sp. 2224.1]